MTSVEFGGVDITRGYVRSADGQIHYRAAGEGPRSLVLLHQIPSSSAMWERVIPLFAARGYRTVALDIPGYGMSDSPPHKPDLSWYGDAVVRALQALGSETAFFLGHHTGGSIALTVAVESPERVLALAIWGFALVDEAAREVLANEPIPDYGDDGQTILEWWRWRLRFCSTKEKSHVMARSVAELLLAEDNAPMGHRAVARADHEELLKHLSRPLLTMAGNREMLLDGSQRASALSRLVEYRHLGDHGMDVADENPHLLVETVDEFFSKVTRATS